MQWLHASVSAGVVVVVRFPSAGRSVRRPTLGGARPTVDVGLYMPQGGGECYGQHWPEVGAFYTHQGGDCFGQQYRPAYPPPEPEPEGYYYPYGGQPADENPGSCSIQ